MPRRLLLLLVLFAAAPAAAQGALSGRVLDAENDLPLPTATVALWQIAAGDSTFVTGASTGLDGAFRVEDVAAGAYDVVVSFVGYDTRRQRVEVGRGTVELGAIRLDVEAAALGEVQVAAERTQVQNRIDRTVYNTADDPVSEGGTATDVLSTLPSVDVDIDGNVSLRGAASVSVFINGRPAPVSGEFLASYLQSLPAGTIERVEIIPNPSAAFEPDGVGGVINLVLKQDADLGLGGTLTAGTDSQGGVDATTAVTYGRGPWSLAATYGFRNDVRGGSGSSFRRNLYEVAPTTLDQRETEDRTRTSHLLNLSADYALSRATTLTSQFQVGTRGGDETELGTTLRSSSAGDRLFEYERLSEEVDDGLSGDARLGLRHTFGEDHRLTVEARGELSDESERQTYLETLLSGDGVLDQPQRVDEDETERELSLTADYTRTVAGLRIDAGYKGDWERQSTALFAESADAETGAYAPDLDVNNRFDFDQTIHALYGQVAREWGPVGAQVGLRFESARTTFDLATTDEAFPNDYASVFPSAYLSYAPTEQTTLKASYSRRVDRPRTWALNPFPSFDDPLNVRQGNPNLRPEYISAFELGATQFTPWGSLSLTPYYRHTTDVVTRLSTVRPDGVTVRTFENLDTSSSYGVELVSSFEDIGGLRGFVSLEGFRLQTEGTSAEADVSNDAFGWGGRANASYGLGDRFGLGGLDLQATGRYSAPITTEQGRRGARSWFDVALRQKLLGDRASLTLQLRDPLGMAGFAFTLDQPDLYQTFERDWGARQIGLTFSYSFGKQERAERRRDNDGGGDFEGGEEF